MRHLAYAPDGHWHEVEQTITLVILRAEDGARFTHARLQEWLGDVEPHGLDNALARLVRRNVVRLKGKAVEAANSHERLHKLDLLAAVVPHVLVAASRPLTVLEVC